MGERAKVIVNDYSALQLLKNKKLDIDKFYSADLKIFVKVAQQEIDRLNNIINGIEEFFQYEFDNEVRPLNDRKISVWTICLDKLKELKEGNK